MKSTCSLLLVLVLVSIMIPSLPNSMVFLAANATTTDGSNSGGDGNGDGNGGDDTDDGNDGENNTPNDDDNEVPVTDDSNPDPATAPEPEVVSQEGEEQSQPIEDSEEQEGEQEEEAPGDNCLFDPDLPECTPDDEGCPEGFSTNEDGQCFPIHEQCPSGYHSQEDDESGKCIPDDVPCDEGYVRNPDFPSCDREEYVCQQHPDLETCRTDPTSIMIDVIVNAIFNSKTVTKEFTDSIEVDNAVLALNYTEGIGTLCLTEDDKGQYQNFTLPNNAGEPFGRTIKFS